MTCFAYEPAIFVVKVKANNCLAVLTSHISVPPLVLSLIPYMSTDCFQQQEQMHLVSMLLIGPPHAGKSSLMRKLIGGLTEESPLPSSELGSAICNSGPNPPSSEPHPCSSESHPPSSEPHPPNSEPHTPCSELAETVLIKKVDSKLVMINGEGEWRVLNDPPCQADCCSSQLSSANILTGECTVPQTL